MMNEITLASQSGQRRARRQVYASSRKGPRGPAASLYRDNQRIATIGRRTRRFRQAELAADDVGPEHERDHLVEGMAPAHAFATHPAIGTDDETIGRNELQGAPDVVGDLLGPLDLQSVMVDDADGD